MRHRWLWASLALCLAVGPSWGTEKHFLPYGGGSTPDNPWPFSKTVCDGDIDNAWEQLSEFAGFTQLAANNTVSVVVRSTGTDTLSVILEGVLAADSKIDTVLLENVAPGVTAASTQQFKYFDSAVLTEEATGASPFLVWATGSSPRAALLDSIPAGRLDYPVQIRFSGGDHELYIEEVEFSVPSASTYVVDFQLRCYLDDAQARDLTDGYFVAARARVDASKGPASVTKQVRVSLPPGSFYAVWALGASTNQEGCATVIGKRWK